MVKVLCVIISFIFKSELISVFLQVVLNVSNGDVLNDIFFVGFKILHLYFFS